MGHRAGLESAPDRDFSEAALEAGPSSNVSQSEKDERRESEDDQEELQNFVVDGAGESAEEDVGEHDQRGDDHADVEAPAE